MKTKSLFTRARETDITILKEDRCKLLETKPDGATPLHWLVTKGSIVKIARETNFLSELLAHPLITEAKMNIKIYSPKKNSNYSYWRYYKRRLVAEEINEIQGVTPLHLLAHLGVKETLLHPLVGSEQDSQGNTPLHLLACASQGKSNDIVTPLWKLLFKHPDFNKVKNNLNQTPLDCFDVNHHPLFIKTLRKVLTYVPSKYLDNERVTQKIWEEIRNVPNSIKFILED